MGIAAYFYEFICFFSVDDCCILDFSCLMFASSEKLNKSSVGMSGYLLTPKVRTD